MVGCTDGSFMPFGKPQVNFQRHVGSHSDDLDCSDVAVALGFEAVGTGTQLERVAFARRPPTMRFAVDEQDRVLDIGEHAHRNRLLLDRLGRLRHLRLGRRYPSRRCGAIFIGGGAARTPGRGE